MQGVMGSQGVEGDDYTSHNKDGIRFCLLPDWRHQENARWGALTEPLQRPSPTAIRP